MPIRLSKKGWNNVLIFSCMFMILLFNYTSNMFSSNGDNTKAQPLLESGSMVQAIDFSGIELQRVGTGWRVLSKIPTATLDQPVAYIDTWINQPLEQITTSPMVLDSASSLPVAVWLAGQNEARLYKFVIDHQQQSVYVHDQTRNIWFALDYQHLSQFIPSVLLSTDL